GELDRPLAERSGLPGDLGEALVALTGMKALARDSGDHLDERSGERARPSRRAATAGRWCDRRYVREQPAQRSGRQRGGREPSRVTHPARSLLWDAKRT